MSSSAESARPIVPTDRLDRARSAFRAAQRALDAAREELFDAQVRAARDHHRRGSRS